MLEFAGKDMINMITLLQYVLLLSPSVHILCSHLKLLQTSLNS